MKDQAITDVLDAFTPWGGQGSRPQDVVTPLVGAGVGQGEDPGRHFLYPSMGDNDTGFAKGAGVSLSIEIGSLDRGRGRGGGRGRSLNKVLNDIVKLLEQDEAVCGSPEARSTARTDPPLVRRSLATEPPPLERGVRASPGISAPLTLARSKQKESHRRQVSTDTRVSHHTGDLGTDEGHPPGDASQRGGTDPKQQGRILEGKGNERQ